jgi:hypothetical protein
LKTENKTEKEKRREKSYLDSPGRSSPVAAQQSSPAVAHQAHPIQLKYQFTCFKNRAKTWSSSSPHGRHGEAVLGFDATLAASPSSAT